MGRSASDAELLTAFKIEAADLDANRQGRLGACQSARLKRNAAGFIVLGLVFAGALCTPLIERLIDGSRPSLGPSIAVGAAGLFMLVAFARFARQAVQAQGSRITTSIGEVVFTQAGRVVRVAVGERAGLQLPAGTLTHWQRLFGDQTYRAYIRDPGGWIVALEVSAPAPEDPVEVSLCTVTESTWVELATDWDAFRKDPSHTSWSTESGAVPAPTYSPALTALWGRLTTLASVEPFDWQSWGGLTRYAQGVGVLDAPVGEAVRLIVALQRAERMGEGTIGNAAEDGTIKAITKRLLGWHEQRVRDANA